MKSRAGAHKIPSVGARNVPFTARDAKSATIYIGEVASNLGAVALPCARRRPAISFEGVLQVAGLFSMNPRARSSAIWRKFTPFSFGSANLCSTAAMSVIRTEWRSSPLRKGMTAPCYCLRETMEPRPSPCNSAPAHDDAYALGPDTCHVTL